MAAPSPAAGPSLQLVGDSINSHRRSQLLMMITGWSTGVSISVVSSPSAILSLRRNRCHAVPFVVLVLVLELELLLLLILLASRD
jgi:hypothetical protein